MFKYTTHTVFIQGMKFEPEKIQVRKEDVVEWINKDIVLHDVTEIDKSWRSGTLGPGEKFLKTITEDLEYFCSIHIAMQGQVVALEH